MNLIPRDSFKLNTGLTQTTFTINNMEPTSDDEAWLPLTTLVGDAAGANGVPTGACANTFNEVTQGYDENSYVPEVFAMKTRTVCKDEMLFNHRPETFFAAYFEETTKRSKRALEKRLESIYMQYARKVSLTAGMSIVDTIGKPYSGAAGLLYGKSVVPLARATSSLTQDHLDFLAIELIDAGATNPDSNGFISLGDDGPVFSLYIGLAASQQIAKINPEFRTDVRYAEPSLLLKRLGAGRVIKNFRHIPNLRPPRFNYGGTITVTTATTAGNTTVNGSTVLTASVLTAVTDIAGGTGLSIANVFKRLFSGGAGIPITGTGIPANSFIGYYDGGATTAGKLVIVNAAGVPVAATGAATVVATLGTAGEYTRVPTYIEVAATGKGKKSIINPAWNAAGYEAAIVTSPHVFTDEIIRPRNSLAGMNWKPTNYMGEWQWVTGAEKFNAECVGTDPLGKLGAYFAEFKHAPRPEHPAYGMTIIFKRADAPITDLP